MTMHWLRRSDRSDMIGYAGMDRGLWLDSHVIPGYGSGPCSLSRDHVYIYELITKNMRSHIFICL